MFNAKSENLLIIKTDGLTSFIAAEPVFEAIRKANPRAKISLLTHASLQRIARAAPYFDLVAAMPDFRQIEAKAAFVRQLKNAKFARVLDLSADEDSGRLKAALGPFGPKWFAVDPPARRRAKKGAPETGIDYGRLLDEAGVAAPTRLPDLRWALAARKDSANMQPSWFGVSGTFGLLLPGGEDERRWPAANYAQLARKMAQARIMPVMAGGKELHAFGDEIGREAPEIVDLCGKTDHLQLTALAQEAAFFVTDASDELHLAVSVGCAGVIIRKAADLRPTPEGRHVVTLKANGALEEASADFVWRTLQNMGLIADRSPPRAVSR